MQPTVSVIIPTHDRPQLVLRAVRSALAQTRREIEVIVVLEAGDPAATTVTSIADPRLRLETLPERVAPGAARNAGVRCAQAEWVTFLDDDDEWMPAKLEQQLATARHAGYPYPIVSCRLIARRGNVDFHWPRRLPEPGEPISEYLFCHRRGFWGEGMAPSSTLFTSRELMRKVPFPETMPRQEDHHWLLEAAQMEGARVLFPASAGPLAIRHIGDTHNRIGNRPADWRFSFDWIRANPHLVTRRAYAGFLLGGLSRNAARHRQWDSFVPVLREALRRGEPSVRDVVFYFAIWLLPESVKRRIAASRAS